MSRHLRAATVTPDSAGWSYCGIRLERLSPGVPTVVRTGDSEAFVLPLVGALEVEVRDPSGHVEAQFLLEGRESVFARISDFAYVGRDSEVVLRSDTPAEVALPSARCRNRLPSKYGAAEAVPVEVRGAGQATRQVTGFGVPGAWDHAERLMCCEVLTPGGNWSSYPPHKHDVTDPCQVANEEIYYYRLAEPTGYGVHLTSTGPEHHSAGLAPLDDRLVVRDGDIVLVPYGYHGPSAAAPGYDLYYLNVLAGPDGTRSMAFCDDPVHAWVRESWNEQQPDPRVPMTSARGPRAAVAMT